MYSITLKSILNRVQPVKGFVYEFCNSDSGGGKRRLAGGTLGQALQKTEAAKPRMGVAGKRGRSGRSRSPQGSPVTEKFSPGTSAETDDKEVPPVLDRSALNPIPEGQGSGRHGGARRFSRGVRKLCSSCRTLISALARASGCISNNSRVKVTSGIWV